MTRINVGIPVSRLTDRHLLAEHREIKRIPNALKQGRAKLDAPIPERFTLGKGHVRFFYNKLAYLDSRYMAIYQECLRRGFDVTCYGGAFANVPEGTYNAWKPKASDVKLIVERIRARGGFKPKEIS